MSYGFFGVLTKGLLAFICGVLTIIAHIKPGIGGSI